MPKEDKRPGADADYYSRPSTSPSFWTIFVVGLFVVATFVMVILLLVETEELETGSDTCNAIATAIATSTSFSLSTDCDDGNECTTDYIHDAAGDCIHREQTVTTACNNSCFIDDGEQFCSKGACTGNCKGQCGFVFQDADSSIGDLFTVDFDDDDALDCPEIALSDDVGEAELTHFTSCDWGVCTYVLFGVFDEIFNGVVDPFDDCDHAVQQFYDRQCLDLIQDPVKDCLQAVFCTDCDEDECGGVCYYKFACAQYNYDLDDGEISKRGIAASPATKKGSNKAAKGKPATASQRDAMRADAKAALKGKNSKVSIPPQKPSFKLDGKDRKAGAGVNKSKGIAAQRRTEGPSRLTTMWNEFYATNPNASTDFQGWLKGRAFQGASLRGLKYHSVP